MQLSNFIVFGQECYGRVAGGMWTQKQNAQDVADETATVKKMSNNINRTRTNKT